MICYIVRRKINQEFRNHITLESQNGWGPSVFLNFSAAYSEGRVLYSDLKYFVKYFGLLKPTWYAISETESWLFSSNWAALLNLIIRMNSIGDFPVNEVNFL